MLIKLETSKEIDRKCQGVLNSYIQEQENKGDNENKSTNQNFKDSNNSVAINNNFNSSLDNEFT